MGALEVFHRYMGTGLILIWYLICLVFLYLKEERKPVRVLLLYLPLSVLFLFFNPLFFGLYDRFIGGETSFRILWLLPVSITIAYCVIKILQNLKGNAKAVFAVVSTCLLILTGTLVYRNPLFSVAENADHVPEEVALICDRIIVPGREVMAAFPAEFLLYVRQYTADVCMPYGRENMQGLIYDEFYQMMLGRELSVSQLAEYAKEMKCHYVIFSDSKILTGGRMEDYDYELYGRVGEYLIYRDNTMDFRNTMD